MGRTRPETRLDDLAAAATEVFISCGGYRRTQMADVARALGVSQGTLYLYVESKEALFDLAVRRADARGPWETGALPIPTPPPDATLDYVARRLAEERAPPRLEAALAGPAPRALGPEFAAVAAELYDALERNRVGIKLLDRCAPDFPALARLWFEGARGALVARLAAYLDSPQRRPRLREFGEPAVAARFVLETAALFAVHRRWDPAPQPMDDRSARETTLRLLQNAFVRE